MHCVIKSYSVMAKNCFKSPIFKDVSVFEGAAALNTYVRYIGGTETTERHTYFPTNIPEKMFFLD